MTDTLTAFGDRVAEGSPAPGGGAVAAVTASYAAALVALAGRVALSRDAGRDDPGFREMVQTAETLRERLLVLAGDDEAAFSAVVEARRSGDPAATARAWRRAIQVPAEVIQKCRSITELARRAARNGPRSTVADAAMAALLSAAAAAGSQVNLRLNLESAGRPEDLRVLADDMGIELREAQRAAADARLAVEERAR